MHYTALTIATIKMHAMHERFNQLNTARGYTPSCVSEMNLDKN